MKPSAFVIWGFLIFAYVVVFIQGIPFLVAHPEGALGVFAAAFGYYLIGLLFIWMWEKTKGMLINVKSRFVGSD
jgi:membrane protease YdiL (CAAX protease family)